MATANDVVISYLVYLKLHRRLFMLAIRIFFFCKAGLQPSTPDITVNLWHMFEVLAWLDCELSQCIFYHK